MKTSVVFLALLGFVLEATYGAVVAPNARCPREPLDCVRPDCFCSGTSPPINDYAYNLNPQIVYLTFDDAITVRNYPLYQDIFSRKNPNGAHITGTFFIAHEYNDYNLTHQMYRQGHEIALHSISHKSDTAYWKNLPAAGWKEEVADQLALVEWWANIPPNNIIGFRSPFLQGGGDTMYQALVDAGLTYESSRPSWRMRPNLFPYTMDYDTAQDCQIEPCPTGAYPGFWVSPLVDLLGNNSQPCAFVDTCQEAPDSKEATFNLLKKNFLEHYNGNRAPFGLYTHAAWLTTPETPWILEGYLEFVDYVVGLGDAYIVSIAKGLDWMKEPVASDNISSFERWQDTVDPGNRCSALTCVLDADHTPFPSERLMVSCKPCPTNYPWLGNVYGD